MSQIPIRVNRVTLLMWFFFFLFDDKEDKRQHSDNDNVIKRKYLIFLHKYSLCKQIYISKIYHFKFNI